MTIHEENSSEHFCNPEWGKPSKHATKGRDNKKKINRTDHIIKITSEWQRTPHN